MTIDEAIRHCLEVAEKNETKAQKIGVQFLGTTKDKEATECRECAADHSQLAEWLTELKELKNSIGAVKLSDMKEALELIREYKAENATLREFNDKIYDVLSEQFGCPCNFSPIDECDDCCGAIPDKECWSRYIQTKLIGGITDEHS
jgi:hypothetical protein